MVVYTTKVGGTIHVQWNGEENFREMLETGLTPVEWWKDDPPPQQKLAMVALLDVRELHDFVIEAREREMAAEKAA